MTRDEIIQELINKGIILELGDAYFLTEKYKEVHIQVTDSKPVAAIPLQIEDIEEISETKTTRDRWSYNIRESKGRIQASHFIDECEIPVYDKAKSYRLRSLDKESVAIIGSIVTSTDISPIDFIEAVKIYYTKTEKPMALKRLLLEGEIFQIYNEYITGELHQSKNEDNEQWR